MLAAAGVGVRAVRPLGARPRTITRQINKVTYLASPSLGWPDLRAGRVRVARCCSPAPPGGVPESGQAALWAASALIGDELTTEVAAILHQVTGHTYTFDHDPLTRTLIGTETVIVEQDTVIDAELVLAPLVASWFDPAAHIASVSVDEPAAVVDEDATRR